MLQHSKWEPIQEHWVLPLQHGNSTSWNILLLMLLMQQMLVVSHLKQVLLMVGPYLDNQLKLVTLFQDSIWMLLNSLPLELGMEPLTLELVKL